MTVLSPELDELEIIDPDHYVEHGYPHEAWTRLRQEAPLHWFEQQDVPFWAVTRHADIVAVSRQPERFASGPRFQLSAGAGEPDTFTIISMDPPQHAVYRQLLSRRFTPRALRAIAGDLERIAVEIIDALGEGDGSGECDFVEQVAAPLPIAVIAWLLGLPTGDWKLLFRWTNEVVGASDPEYRRAGEDAAQTRDRATSELFSYFSDLAAERRKAPRDDLVSALVESRVDGERLGSHELLAYYLILVAAGNETTRNATSGGLLAFIDHPSEWERLRREPKRLASAVEEVLRWTSPIIQMARTATADVELGGHKIRAGETLALFYPSANRDEAVFADPFVFRIDRRPNAHLAFGVGEHFCMGAHLARLELQAAFRQLARRIVHLELAGPVSRLRSSAVGGVKRLPIRYQLAQAR